MEAAAARLRRLCLAGCELPSPPLLAMYLDCTRADAHPVPPRLVLHVDDVARRRRLCRGLCA